MKQIFYIAFVSIVIAGCNDNSAADRGKTGSVNPENPINAPVLNSDDGDFYLTGDVNVDTLGMAEFLAMKAEKVGQYRQTKTGQTNTSGRTSNTIKVDTSGFAEYKRSKAATARQGQVETSSQFKTEAEAKAYADSLRREAIVAKNRKVNASRNTATNKTGTTSKQTNSNNTATSTDQTKDVAQQPPPKTAKKKSTSNRVKGAVIGGVTGAAAGAVINKKNRTKGGIIGGILGAGAGYGIGRSKDKKDSVKTEPVRDTTNNKQR